MIITQRKLFDNQYEIINFADHILDVVLGTFKLFVKLLTAYLKDLTKILEGPEL